MTSTRTGWTTARVVAASTGCVVALIGITVLGVGALAAGAALDDDPYTDFGESADFRGDGYAVSSDPWTPDYVLPGVESIRFEVTAGPSAAQGPDERAVFAGFAEVADAEAYLAGVRHTALHDGYTEREQVEGTAPETPPTRADIWVARADGTGTRALELDPADVTREGAMPIVMNADGSRQVDAHVEIAYRMPGLPGIAATLVIGGALVTAGGVLLVLRPIRRARRP